jgi:hypothetical protein
VLSERASRIDVGDGRASSLRSWDRRRFLACVSVAVVAFAARFCNIQSSYDVFLDEVTYTRIAENLADGHGLTLYGRPFDLHPPAFFALYSLAIRVLPLPPYGVHLLLELRAVTAVLGGLSAGLAFYLASLILRPGWALVTAAFVTLDPFLVLFDSRVMLETMAQLSVLAGIILIVKASRQSGSARTALIFGAGLAFGVTVTTKETFGVVVALLLLALLATKAVIRRTEVLVVIGVVTGAFALSVLLVCLTGGFAAWWSSNTEGLQCLVGTSQITGFNAPTTHVSLLSRVFANASMDAVTYITLAVGSLAALKIVFDERVLLRLRSASDLALFDAQTQSRLLIALWTLSGCVYLGYATVFGSLEEQMYYIVLLPCLLSLATVLNTSRPPSKRTKGTALRLLVLACLLFDSVVWIDVHVFTKDNEYQAFLAWERSHLPIDSRVAVTESTAQFLLKDVIVGHWTTIAELKAQHANYVVVVKDLIREGYSDATPAFLTELDRHARLVFHSQGRSEGELEVFNVDGLTGSELPG